MMGRAAHILLVDDSAAARRPLAEVLSKGGFEVSEASEGVEALYKARAAAFDMIITDIHMPAMDGITFLKELRKLSQYGRTPVVVLTSDVSASRIDQMRQAGGSGWLEKPPDLSTIVDLVLTTLENSSRLANV